MSRIRKILLYGGLEKQDYQDCQPDIGDDNRSKLHVYLNMAAGMLFAAACISGGMSVLRNKTILYGIAFLICAGLRLLDMMLPDKNGLFLQWMMYAFAAVLYVLGIVSAAGTPDELSVSFIAFMLAVPLLFVMPPIHHMANVVFFDVIFVVAMVMTEEGHTLSIDIVDAVFFGVISCVISTFTMLMMYQNALSSKKLREIADFDILTGMKNRNAFERERDSWTERCTVSLSCVYVDVNGLHELNNSEGHDRGDRMLQTVAMELRSTFGKNNCYRTGGDEFVVFVMDQQYAAVRKNVSDMIFRIGEQGYSVAVGVATESAGGIEVGTLARKAEKRMYLEKEEHYRALNQTGR